MAYFRVPVNLPHAATVSKRIQRRLWMMGFTEREDGEHLMALIQELCDRVAHYEGANDPPDDVARSVCDDAARIGRSVVDEIERRGIGEDRLGQMIRNLFECLGKGEEGAEISLRAGEDPNSLMRPI
jgi:hypothetical protein